MPRLSIIIPHRRNDPRLESTILSVLENRPDDSEVIVVHDGSYTDPYQLGDELLFVESNAGAGCAELLNSGVMAACSPIVCTLLDGILVTPGWVESAMEQLEDSQVAAASACTQTSGSRKTYGIDAASLKAAAELQRGRVELSRTSKQCAGPQLSCGFYRTKILRAVGGWNEQFDFSIADIDLSWTLQALGLPCVVAEHSVVTATADLQRTFSNASMKQLAELSVAYGVSTSGAKSAMSDLLRGCLSGNVSLAVAWSSGVMGGRATPAVTDRLKLAEERLAEQAPALKVFTTAEPSYRRHAA